MRVGARGPRVRRVSPPRAYGVLCRQGPVPDRTCARAGCPRDRACEPVRSAEPMFIGVGTPSLRGAGLASDFRAPGDARDRRGRSADETDGARPFASDAPPPNLGGVSAHPRVYVTARERSNTNDAAPNASRYGPGEQTRHLRELLIPGTNMLRSGANHCYTEGLRPRGNRNINRRGPERPARRHPSAVLKYVAAIQ
jgi:hypothetical protein